MRNPYDPPYPEFGTHWEKPQGPPCPNCECCTARLCRDAATSGLACSAHADNPGRVRGCPCTTARTPAAVPGG